MPNDLLLLHGALYTSREFGPLQDVLEKDFRLHTLDFIGHGEREMPAEPYTIRLFGEDVLRLMDTKGIEKGDLFGFSMGGYVGLWLALHYPDRIGRIMTLGTKLDWNPETSAREVTMLDAEKIEQKVPRFAEQLKERHGSDRWQMVLGKTAEMMINLGDNPEMPIMRLGELDHQIRLSLGDRDHMVSIEETVQGYRQLQKGELAILPGTGHPLEKIDPVWLGGMIRTFLARS